MALGVADLDVAVQIGIGGKDADRAIGQEFGGQLVVETEVPLPAGGFGGGFTEDDVFFDTVLFERLKDSGRGRDREHDLAVLVVPFAGAKHRRHRKAQLAAAFAKAQALLEGGVYRRFVTGFAAGVGGGSDGDPRVSRRFLVGGIVGNRLGRNFDLGRVD